MSFLKNAIDAIDPAPDKKKDITLALQVLFELAEQKSVLFKRDLENSLRTAGTPDNQTIPVTQVLAWHSETRAYVKDDASKLAEVILGSIKKFIGGGTNDIISGIGDLATAALEGILGAGSGTQAEMHSYYIVVEGLSIVRMDISAWSRRIEATGITTKIENAMAFQASKSSVNVDAITFNTFLQAYKSQLDQMKLPPDKLMEFIKQSKEIFELLRDKNAAVQDAGFSHLIPPGEVEYHRQGAFRAYGIIKDADKDVLVMGTKKSGFLAGFLVFFGGALQLEEPSKDAFLRELAEESNKRVECPADDAHRFKVIDVYDPTPASLFFFRALSPKYTTGEIPHGEEIGSVVAVSIDKLLIDLPENPDEVTPALVANAVVKHYGGGADMETYRKSGIMRALRDYLVEFYYS